MKATESSTHFTLDDLYTVEQFAEKHSERLTVSTLRYQMRHRQENGLASAVVKLGRFEMLVEPLYNEWLTTRAGKS